MVIPKNVSLTLLTKLTKYSFDLLFYYIEFLL